MLQIRVTDVFIEQPHCCGESQGDENQPIGRGSMLLGRFNPEVQTHQMRLTAMAMSQNPRIVKRYGQSVAGSAC